jgi:hypothetical protein
MSTTKPSQEENQHISINRDWTSRATAKNARQASTGCMLLLTCFLTGSRAKADDGIVVACEGISCRYIRPPEEDDVTDDNLFRHDLCVPDANGLFGSSQGEEQSVDYFYQVETEPTMTSADRTGVLGEIEISISRTILPELLSEECAPAINVTRMRRKRVPRRRLEVMGVSSNPADKVFDGGACVSATSFGKVKPVLISIVCYRIRDSAMSG